MTLAQQNETVNGDTNEKSDEKPNVRPDGKRELTEEDAYECLAYNWPTWKKWMYLSSIATIQIAMNYNTSVYPNAVMPLVKEFGITQQKARTGQMIYLLFYSFGCELWAPWSEEFGRWPILQLSETLINIFILPAALAPNFASILAGRALSGLSTAGGSVTLGLIADLYQPDEQQFPLAFIVLSSCIGTSIGGVIGGPIERYLGWRWNFWTQLIFNGFAQAVHFFMPESRSTIILDREAKRRRKTGEDPNVYGPNELKKPRISLKEMGTIWMRPWYMLVTEPIVLCLSLLSGFSDALIFTFLESFTPVYSQWNFGILATAWAFIPINVAYFIAYFSYYPWFWRDEHIRKTKGADALIPERRLKWLLWTAPLEPIGLFCFAWTSQGPSVCPWIVPMIFSAFIGIANFTIYFSSVDYMVAAYGVYSASATGGNAWARDFFAGISAMYATPLYHNIGHYPRPAVNNASTILASLSCVIVLPIYVFYWYGPQIRDRSKFAKTLAADRVKTGGRRLSKADNIPC
ncbi:MFS general substrate transporter [Polychaeton citri CBS 116435]|uniref:MFS general substrate transporter n=1 Tax=Polychaeton citri CBS 116435 TaxID=1314669 RepID=A0A9P4UST3_9PEZI|nr:MFS general substrate transporter [Polychaeton citri CBS 116435]